MLVVATPHIGRDVYLREATADEQVWADTFTGLYHLPPEPFAPATVLDVGANVGLTAAHYRHLWPDAEIVAVELDYLNAYVARMNFDGEVVVAAVGSVDDVRRYRQSGSADGYRLADDGLAVPGVRLGTLVRTRCRGGRCDFAKIDVEGAEWEILGDGANWAPLVESLLVELHAAARHGQPDDSDALVAAAGGTLVALGYRVVRHVAHPRAVWARR